MRRDPSAKLELLRMRKRADFLRAQKGRRQNTAAFTLESCPSPSAALHPRTARVGFTASRKVGKAVSRNRAKRRLRAAAAQVLPLSGREGHDYVLVARPATLSRPFADLSVDLIKALRAIHAALDSQSPARKENEPSP